MKEQIAKPEKKAELSWRSAPSAGSQEAVSSASATPASSSNTGVLSLQRVLASIPGAFGENADTLQKQPNKTGMPNNLKSGLENLSGMDLSSTRVHRNSPKPAEVGAHAYTQGSNIFLGPSQEKHLPHEAWHVVQQAQGRVKPTGSVAGLPLNDSKSLESEADRMGALASRSN